MCLEFTSLLLEHSPIGGNSFSVTIFHDNLLHILLDEHDEVSELAIKILLQYSHRLNQIESILKEILFVMHSIPFLK